MNEEPTSTFASPAEKLKSDSGFLRGHIAEDLASGGTHFGTEQAGLLKFHGIYEQEDRDARQARKAAGVEKAYQFMVRSRIPGGALTAEQYLVEDALAARFANGTLRITTRQGLQLHGVLKGNLRPALRAINKALLSTLAACGDVNRNVMCCPAPAADGVQQSIQVMAGEIAERLKPKTTAYHEIWLNGECVRSIVPPAQEEPLYGVAYLPRKFKIGIARPADNCVDVYTQDIGLVAHAAGQTVTGYTVLVGGGLGATHGKAQTYPRLATPLCYVCAERTLEAVEAIVTIQRDFGDRTNRRHARMKYLVEEKGIRWFEQELERRLGWALEPPRQLAWQGVDDHLGWHPQGNGLWYAGIYVENGRIKDTETVALQSALRALVGWLRPGLRLTGQQNILLTDIADGQRSLVDSLLGRHGVAVDPRSLGISRDAMACPALPTCGLALADAERALPQIVSEIEEDVRALGLGSERLSVRMTGCPNGCARPYMGDIGFVGRSKNLYNVHVGGDRENTRMNSLFAENVSTVRLREVIRPLLELWRDERVPNETFGDFCSRLGMSELRRRSEPASVS